MSNIWKNRNKTIPKNLKKTDFQKSYTYGKYRNPLVTVDLIIEIADKIVLIKRVNPPYGWALPGGFVDYGESLETAAVREAAEEINLEVTLREQFHTYSDPDRDPRQHTVTTVYIAEAKGTPKPGDDAGEARLFSQDTIPADMAFDHEKIIEDYFRYCSGESKKGILGLRLEKP
jgi:8-oxo-dGTP diphosphatase